MQQIFIKHYIALLFAIISISAFSQTSVYKPYVGIGFHGGMNITDVKFTQGVRDNDIDYEYITVNSGGFVLNFMAESYAGIQLELNFANRGWQEIKDSVYTYRRDMKYLEIPVLTHLSFGKKYMRFIFNLGPYIAFHRESTETFEIYNKHLIVNEDQSIEAFMMPIDKSADLGFMFDFGVGVNTLAGVFQVKARYSQGVISIFDIYPKGIYSRSQMRNVYFGVSYSYNIYFKGRE